MSKNNMDLWNSVCKTDVKHTKKVNIGRSFTAIDAMYQIQKATEVFGAAGEGWGWEFSEPLFVTNDTVVLKCTLWHGKRENKIEQFGQKKLMIKDKPDEDALKKAATDALTKCLSYLGFSADVFLGRFDDNKYIELLQKEQALTEWSAQFKKKLLATKTQDELKLLISQNNNYLKDCMEFEDIFTELQNLKNEQLKKLGEENNG